MLYPDTAIAKNLTKGGIMVTILEMFKDKNFKFSEDCCPLEKVFETRTETTKALLEIGIPINMQGFRFLRECIIFVALNPLAIKSMTKLIYPTVANLFETSSAVVERSIRHACEIGFNKTLFSPLTKFFELSDESSFNYKPTTSELVALLAELMRMRTLNA